MQYELSIEKVTPIRRNLAFEVPAEVVHAELDRAYKTTTRDARLPGFRKGKVPRMIIEARFGKQIAQDVSGALIDKAWRQAAQDLEVAGQPSLQAQGEVQSGRPFTFVIGVDVRPEVELVAYKGLQIAYNQSTVTDDDVSAQIDRRLAARARLVEVTGRPVEPGDHVLTALHLSAGDEVFADDQGTLVNTGAERFYPGVEALLMGLEIGQSAEGEVTIGAGSALEALRGKTVAARVAVQAIQARRPPELTDELAAELGYEGGVEGMRLAVRGELEAGAQQASRNAARVQVLQKLVEAHDFDVPVALVEEQYEAITEEARVQRAYRGADPRSIRFSDAELADLRNRARFAAKAGVLLSRVAAVESITVLDADLDAKIAEIASSRHQTPAAIRGYLEKEGAMPVLRDRVLEEKVLEWLLENADLTSAAPAEAPAEAPAAE